MPRSSALRTFEWIYGSADLYMNQGGTAGNPVPMGHGDPAFFISAVKEGRANMAKEKKLVEALGAVDSSKE